MEDTQDKKQQLNVPTPTEIATALREKVSITGTLKITLTGPDGKVKEERLIENLVVSSGKSAISSRLGGTATAAMTHMGVGTNSTAPAATDVALGTELVKVGLTTTVITNNTIAYTCTFGAGVGTGALVEAGMFNGTTAAAGGLSYTRSGAIITVTKASHGLATGRAIGIASATRSTIPASSRPPRPRARRLRSSLARTTA